MRQGGGPRRHGDGIATGGGSPMEGFSTRTADRAALIDRQSTPGHAKIGAD